MIVAALMSLLFAIGDKWGAAFVVITSSAFNAATIVAWNVLDCASVEAFPTTIRTTAMGIQAAGGRIGSMAAQFVNAQLAANGVSGVASLLIVNAAVVCVGGGLCFLLPPQPAEDKRNSKLDYSFDA
eukprot:TRINITY_DN62231_c0_g1_i1.p2 TRINITY_DN62231_c0_g1~~TRINITY_DN62231_c0_g1_i1.p2  ORF type:complete len:127 (+),score=27.93 TRINITY_DN62231_c0_g1_i1:1261-1641(+)